MRKFTWILKSPGNSTLALILGLAPLTASAVENHFTGYASVGVVSNDHPYLEFRRDLTQNNGPRDGELDWRTDTSVGVQWNAHFSHQFDTTIQVVARDRFNNSLEQSVQWAFLRYRPEDGLDIRLGRLGSDVFMLSEYRQVGYAMQWVRAPVDYYGWLALYYFDGVDVNKRFDFSGGTLNIKVFYGNTTEVYPTSYGAEGVKVDFDPSGVSFNLEWGQWRARYTYSHVTVNNNYLEPLLNGLNEASVVWPEASALAEGLNPKGKNIQYQEVGFGFDNNTWWAQTEYTELTSTISNVTDSRYFYFSAGRRFNSLSLYGIYGFNKPKYDYVDVEGPAGLPPLIAQQLQPLVEGTELTINSSYLDQNSVGAGVRWDFAVKKALKFQVEHYDIAANGNNLWVNPEQVTFTEDQSATVISLSLDILF